ncbi:MAG TPA: PLP-dependent aminotransferase family protein [Gaiellaceae bacterium]|nr:PLP-dependent aminotransferase family protein [Gaiellaceae bacterium]
MGTRLPSTRSLAVDLGVSRGVVVGAYAQLAAEGYIELRRGAVPTVAATGRAPSDVRVDPDAPIARARATCLPDFGFFPRAEWLAAVRTSLRRARSGDFSYGEPFGAGELRLRLAPFLARTRGVVAAPDRTGIFAGASQALLTLANVLHAGGARRIGVEDPGHRWRRATIASSGLEIVPVPVDRDGLVVDDIPDVAAVVVSPDHHFPLGVALSPERRRALLDWAAAGDRLVIEHDYDAHFRYDQTPAGALQALSPEHVAYVGSTSALLAPAIRIGWAVLPARFVEPVAHELFATVVGTPRLTQLALAEFVARGYLDRHLRRTRVAFKKRREALVEGLRTRLPQWTLQGPPVGLYISLVVPERTDEAKLLAGARRRGIALDGFNEHSLSARPPGVVLGFAAAPEPTLRRGAGLLRAAWEEVGARSS